MENTALRENSALIRAECSWPKGPFPGEAPGSSHIHNFIANSSMKVLFPGGVESFGVFLGAPSHRHSSGTETQCPVHHSRAETLRADFVI